MEATETKFNVDEMQQSAIIYRDASARFIYVCYHCGSMFHHINDILPHIESHFTVAKVMVNEIAEDLEDVNAKKEEVPSDNFKLEPLDEILGFLESPPVPISEDVSQPLDDRTDTKESKKNRSMERKKNPQKTRGDKRVRYKRYRCHKCTKTWATGLTLQNHLKTHRKDNLLKIFKCTECDQYFKGATFLRAHVLDVHLKDKCLQCTACSSKFQIPEIMEFLKHLQQHRGGSAKNITTWLNSRGKACKKYEEIDVCNEKLFPCDTCPKTFYLKENWNVHVQTIHKIPYSYECPECHSVCVGLKVYYAHQLEHKRVGPHITETNEEILLSNLDITIAERIGRETESGEHKYRCLICTNVTTEKLYDIREHVRRMHVYKMFPPPLTPKKELFCDMCGKSFTSKNNIIKHFHIHTRAKSHACTICGKTFRLRTDRNFHEKRHSGVKPFQCDACGKSFTSNGSLNAHKMTHENKGYPCEICGKILKHAITYRGHMETHRGERSFKCTVCPKAFTTKIYLRRHMEVHSDRKHPCRHCGSEFNTRDGLAQHYRHKHKDEWEALHPKKSNF